MSLGHAGYESHFLSQWEAFEIDHDSPFGKHGLFSVVDLTFTMTALPASFILKALSIISFQMRIAVNLPDKAVLRLWQSLHI
jgi:hypothetical protein